MYWEKIDDAWHIRDFAGIHKINPNEPVKHVSYYEADAFCKWAKKRLPTEAEWEKAACWNDTTQQKSIFPWGDEPQLKIIVIYQNHTNGDVLKLAHIQRESVHQDVNK